MRAFPQSNRFHDPIECKLQFRANDHVPFTPPNLTPSVTKPSHARSLLSASAPHHSNV